MGIARNLKEQVLQLKSEGKTQTEIRNILNCSKDTVHYHFNSDYQRRKRERRTLIRQETKRKLVDLKGGKCQVCGYKKYVGALQFHHLNPDEKEFTIAENYVSNIDRIMKEINKCILVCGNCHAEIEGGLINIKDFVPIE